MNNLSVLIKYALEKSGAIYASQSAYDLLKQELGYEFISTDTFSFLGVKVQLSPGMKAYHVCAIPSRELHQGAKILWQEIPPTESTQDCQNCNLYASTAH